MSFNFNDLTNRLQKITKTVSVEDIYDKNMVATKEYIEDNQYLPYFLGVYNGIVIDSDKHVPKYMTKEEFIEEFKDIDFNKAVPYKNLNEFLNDWGMSEDEYKANINFALNSLTKKLGAAALSGALLLGGISCKAKTPTPVTIESTVHKTKTKDIANKIAEAFKFNSVKVLEKELGGYKIYNVVLENEKSCHRYVISLSNLGDGFLEVRSQPKSEKNKDYTERLLSIRGKNYTNKSIKELVDLIREAIKEDKCAIERDINLIEYYDKYRGEL